MSNFPRDLRPPVVGEVPLSVDEVAHGVWDGVIFGPRAWLVLGYRFSTQADVMGGRLVRSVGAGGVSQSRLAAAGRSSASVGME